MRVLSRQPDRRALGGVLLAVAIVAGVLLAWQRPNPFANPTELRAEFRDASQLQVIGADVRMAGTPVGKVSDRQRRGDHAIVTMELNDEAGSIRADATAELRPRLPFEGTAYIDLDPGSPSAPPLGDRELPLSRTRNFVSLDDVLRVADADTRTGIRRTAGGLARALEPGAAGSLNRTLKRAPALLPELETAARAARGRPGRDGRDLRRAIRGLSVTAQAVAFREHDLAPLMRGTAATTRALDTRGGEALRATIRELPGALEQLRVGGRSLEQTLARLRPLAVELDPGLRALAPTLRQARPLLREGAPALEAAEPLVRDLRRAVASGGRAAAPTERVLKALDPTARLLTRSTLPALLRPTLLGPPAYLTFLNLFAGGGGASRPFQTPANGGPPANMGTGHFMRFGFRFLTGAGLPLPPCTLLAKANPALAAAFSALGGCTP